ncbi:MAG: NYN domain-containing protein [Planctomycetota bacterium]|nr:NYN domain-containing protein [Planctomycetota bacterium]
MTSDFGSDIFDETQQSSPSSPGTGDSPAPDSSGDPAGKEPTPGDGGDRSGNDEGQGSRRKRPRARRKPRNPAATSDEEAEPPEASESPAQSASQDEQTDGNGGSDGGGARHGRQRGRRSRGGQGRNRDNRGEDRSRRDRGNRGGRDRGDNRRGSSREDSRPPLDLPARQRVAIFLDASELQASAGEREISFGHLRRHITNARVPIRAIAYHPAKQKDLAKGLAHCGFEVTAVDSKAATHITIAIDAMALADRVDCVILVPGTKSLAHLAKTLQARGVRVETASFEETGDSKLGANEHVAVGAESCFVV